MKNTIKIFIGFLLLSFGCNEDFMELVPQAQESTQSFYSNINGALQAVNAVYDVMQRGERVSRIEFYGDVCSGDAMAGGEPTRSDQPAMQEMMRFQTSTDNLYIRTYWRSMYQGIFRANMVIQNVTTDNLPDEDAVLVNRINAEARFMRSLYYFKLIKFYGAVPLIDHPLNPDEFEQERVPVGDIYHFIQEDLEIAAQNLPLKSEYAPADMGRATKGAAQALQAQAYLYESCYAKYYAGDDRFQNCSEKWDLALSAAEKVINSGEYWLEGGEGHENTYLNMHDVEVPALRWIFMTVGENSGGSIFEIQFEELGGQDEAGEGTLIPVYYGCRQVFDKEGRSIGNWGWGFICPTDYFVETIDKQDPRYKYFVIEPTDKIPWAYPDSLMVDSWAASPTGRHNWKYVLEYEERPDFFNAPLNFKVIRYADLLLWAAEAAFHLDDNGKATNFVNMVRTRARNSGTTGFPQNLSNVTLDDIMEERRIELSFENIRYFDMVRYNKADDILKYAYNNWPENSVPNTGELLQQQFYDNWEKGKHELLPVPQAEIDISNGVLTQNPGYN